MKRYKKHIKNKSSRQKRHLPEKILSKFLIKEFDKKNGPILIAVGGPGGIGKSTFAFSLAQELKEAVVLGLDDYKTSREFRRKKKIFGPHPHANEMDMIKEHLSTLKKNKTIQKPIYCSDNGKINKFLEFDPDRFIIVEGEIATYKDFRDIVDFSIFIDSHWKTQLNTRINRDIEKRGYTPEKAIATFLHSNLREFAEYGQESKNWSDVHIHCNDDYSLVIDAVSEHLVQEIKINS